MTCFTFIKDIVNTSADNLDQISAAILGPL